MDRFFVTITWFGSLYLLIPLALATVAVGYRTLKGVDIWLILAGLCGASVLAHLGKLLFARPRPMTGDLLVTMPADFSFPSAHTAQITAFMLACAIVFTSCLSTRNALALWLITGLCALLIGYSRIYLKVHYASDVVAGAVLGTAWVVLLKWVLGLVFSRG